MTEKPMPTFSFLVTYAETNTSTTVSVNACYMQEEGRFVAFKDATGSVMLAVNADAVIAVERQGLVQ